mgnify:CR=1 FL=1
MVAMNEVGYGSYVNKNYTLGGFSNTCLPIQGPQSKAWLACYIGTCILILRRYNVQPYYGLY